MGDFNLDLLRYEQQHGINEFIELIYNSGCMPSITKPTRISNTSASLIDKGCCIKISYGFSYTRKHASIT